MFLQTGLIPLLQEPIFACLGLSFSSLHQKIERSAIDVAEDSRTVDYEAVLRDILQTIEFINPPASLRRHEKGCSLLCRSAPVQIGKTTSKVIHIGLQIVQCYALADHAVCIASFGGVEIGIVVPLQAEMELKRLPFPRHYENQLKICIQDL